MTNKSQFGDTVIENGMVIKVGIDAPMMLIDYMNEGSTVAHALFSNGILKILKRTDAAQVSIDKQTEDVVLYTKAARNKIFKHAFKALRANRKKTAWDRSIAQSLNEETL